MSDNSSGDKTEKPSPQKLRKAREEGQVTRSRDWATAVGILVSLKAFVLMVPGYLEDFRSLFRLILVPLEGQGALHNAWSNVFYEVALLFGRMVLPLAVVPLLVVLASLYPGGWVLSFKNVMPKGSRLNPLSFAGRLASAKHWSDFAVSLLKCGLVIAVLWHVSTTSVAAYLQLQSQTFDQALVHGAGLMLDGVMAMVVVFILFAVIDVPLQTFLFTQQQRMTKQEVKEEHKSAEGRPEVRQRIRQIQQQISKRSVRKTVPTADVVIVNPEHYAVALKYDEDRAEAPFLVAKGVDEMALYIRQVARESGVEVVPLPPLARAIYNTSQVNQQIPAPLYKAVALVLRYVMQIRAFQAGTRKAAPVLPDDLEIPARLSEVKA
ncbi:flagellar type III secretion system protein FlhB [Aquincola tertiaricarbonis]|uniref:Flagellar type III secretion system protein FlhB n=1 Tax=Aquincola tertiaricarbonis TaxID=391953 RepID=A0ABY4S588_AQUTE|nr:flagellar type III secretion system protein FlhB [Aquincola tertiaricarbonis]URI06276.1 flagellar type III secretion system protein FlhB [Aquincola tertiaricarbonis]